MTITTQAVREMAERLGSWSGLVSSGYECPAAGTAMHEAQTMLLALVEERDRLYARLEMVEAYDGEGNRISVEPYSIPDGIEARDATIRLLDDRVKALTARARELREAQRAYMQNRGNDEYGRKVAEAAERLDVALATFQGRDGDG